MLNQQRIINKKSLPLMIAIGQALSGKISSTWFESIVDSPKDAAKMVASYKAQQGQENKTKYMPSLDDLVKKTKGKFTGDLTGSS
jgi:hypothetical protein